ncbi:MAG: hypothetical protein Q8P12_03335, partial [bacterium]|nr:hypothetical protein [bacterium]
EILSPVQQVAVSPGGAKAALRNNAELWILFLEADAGQPRREAGETVLLTRFSEPVQNLAWVGSHYVLFSLGGMVKTSEIDDRNRLNIADIASFPEPALSWDDKNGILYVLSEGKLLASEKIAR